MNPDLKLHLENYFSEPIKSTSSLAGGCIADSCKLQLESGKVYFLNPLPPRFQGGDFLTRTVNYFSITFFLELRIKLIYFDLFVFYRRLLTLQCKVI